MADAVIEAKSLMVFYGSCLAWGVLRLPQVVQLLGDLAAVLAPARVSARAGREDGCLGGGFLALIPWKHDPGSHHHACSSAPGPA